MNVGDYIKRDRQWPRIHRIRYAKQRLRDAKRLNDVAETVFWTTVLIANGANGRILPSTTWTLERSLANVTSA